MNTSEVESLTFSPISTPAVGFLFVFLEGLLGGSELGRDRQFAFEVAFLHRLAFSQCTTGSILNIKGSK
jgi:hypothetical protein